MYDYICAIIGATKKGANKEQNSENKEQKWGQKVAKLGLLLLLEPEPHDECCKYDLDWK